MKEPDIKADIEPVSDRSDSIGLMEPLLIGESSKHRGALNDLALELAQKSAGFRRSLPESLLTSLADLVRAMNCYDSNLIEGHDTHPIEIERALKGDYSKDAKKRDLQLEEQYVDRASKCQQQKKKNAHRRPARHRSDAEDRCSRHQERRSARRHR